MPPAYTMTAPSRGPAPPMMDYGQDPGADPTMAPLGQSTVQQMDPATMSQLFGDDQDSGGQGDTDQATDQASDQDTGGGVDQDKLQDVLSDPAMLQAVAQVLKTLGTGDDTDLVHVSEDEKTALKQGGGEGTTNPTTGLLQYAKSGYDATDWYSMTPDDRVALIGQAAGLPPSWSNNWWARPGAAQGGPTRNMTGQDFANANVAVTPSWGTALNMAGMVAALPAGGPLGAIMSGLTRSAFGSMFGGSTFGDAFSTPGGRLPPEAVAAVAAAYNDAVNRGLPTAQVLNAANTALATARGAYGGGPGGQPGGPGPGLSAGVGVDAAGHAYGTNIGGAGVSHNLAAGLAAAQAAADAARGFAAGGYGRAAPAGGGGGGGGGGGLGGGGPSGGDRGGGLGGGAGNKGGGSNRSD